VEKTSPDELTVTWNTDSITGGRPDDQIMILIYGVRDKDRVITGDVFGTVAGEFRRTGIEKIKVRPNPQNPDLDYHVYAAFSAMDRSRQSDSMYLGTIAL